MEFLKALPDRARRAAERAARTAALWAPLIAAALGGAPSAEAASPARLNIDVTVHGVANIIDLSATPGSSTGTVNLSWTEPYHSGGTAPFSYDVRVSSVAQIQDEAAFGAASSLSAVSGDSPPAPGAGGGTAAFVVTGLSQGVTYYFAVREQDSLGGRGAWVRGPPQTWNLNNYAIATSSKPAAPGGGALTAVYASSAAATWAVSASATDYLLAASTSSALPPDPVAASSTTASSTATLAGLTPNTSYFLSVSACGFGCSSFVSVGSTVTLAAPAVGLSTTSVSSSTVVLAWGSGGNPSGTAFVLQRSTDGVSYAGVSTVTVVSAQDFGLSGGGTYYYRVVALNGAGTPAAPTAVLQVITPAGPVPSTPGGLTATPLRLQARLTWNPLPAGQQGTGLAYYALQRSTHSSYGFVDLSTTTSASYTDGVLAYGSTYYYRIYAHATDGVDSAPSAPVSVSPLGALPMEPLGLTVDASSASVAISWTPTSRFFDGTPFLSTGTPTADELEGYSIYRATDICSPTYVQLSTMATSVSSLTDATGGLNYYYRLYSFNTVGRSTNVVTFSSLGERDYFVDDCASTLILNEKVANSLNGSQNGQGDIRIQSIRHPEQVGGGVYQSVEWRATLNGAQALPGYVLPVPARIVLHYDANNGVPTPSTAPVGALSVRSTGAPAGTAAASAQDLGAYWYDGAEYKKMYGRVDANAQTVTVQSPNVGTYQIRGLARAAGAVFDVSNLSSRVITPNGDGRNDTLIFTYDPGPRNVQPTGEIFDVRGAHVASMTPGLVPNTLTWDGKSDGKTVTSGVYVYRIVGDGKTFTGSIVVAR
jgi:hypothetical protein